ncbi:restriction endonuclease [Arcobacter sp. LA11]|uniref:restriction endonuclease n=1 Tax=Arcobacter sp. LA11 TaxID=1898176 RepID=UPI000933C752|nr:restriction endonuclease [Arcobacter sp. LA11]
MKLNKKIAILAIISATGLFAAGLSNVNMLVDKINNTKDVKVKEQLMQKLDQELGTMDRKDLPAAQEIISTKLKKEKEVKK